MIRSLKTLAAAAGCLFVLGASANAQEVAEENVPTISFDSPATGVDLATITDDIEFFDRRGRLTVSGTASDDTRIASVQYRLEGSKRWRKATVLRTGTGATANDYVWSFRVSVRRRSDRRIYVRAVDPFKNESDIIGRKIIRRR